MRAKLAKQIRKAAKELGMDYKILKRSVKQVQQGINRERTTK